MSVKTIMSISAEQSMALGQKIGKNLKGGECIELVADVGGGKTTFVRGLALGAGSKDHVSSPTFTISKVYKTSKFEIVHFDFYRLNCADLIEHEIAEFIDDVGYVVIVEWSDIVQHTLPNSRLVVDIKYNQDGGRLIKLETPKKLEYLLKNVDI